MCDVSLIISIFFFQFEVFVFDVRFCLFVYLFIFFFEYDRKNNCGRIMVWFYCRHLSVDTVDFRAITF